jgi:TatD DNase family protein
MEPKRIDTHTHVNFNAFKDDAEEVVRRTLDAGVWLVNVGTQFGTSRQAVEMAERYSDGVYAAIGLHPIHLFDHHVDEEETSFNARGERFDPESYQELALRSTKVVAIGEFGLDYYRMPKGEDERKVKQLQEQVVKEHLQLAGKLGKPVMIHCRDLPRLPAGKAGAYDELVPLLKNHYVGGGIIHSFTGSWQQAEKFLELGFLIGLNGIITFDRTGRSEEVVRNLGLDQMVLETDAPYLTPAPHRGKRNEPLYTEFVAKKIAEIKGLRAEEVEEQTTQNARKLLNI